MRRLLFVSPRFLFPADEGGKIRTGQVLRGLAGGTFHVTLASPAPPDAASFRGDIERVCDEFVTWPEPQRGRLFGLTRMRHLAGREPIPVATDRNREAEAVVRRELEKKPDVVVIDFVHAAVLAPDPLPAPSVLFTHNVETEIFARQVEVTKDPVRRAIWRDQMRKMEAFERDAARRFDALVAVSERDADTFRERFGAPNVRAIPTGVDTDLHAYEPPGDEDTAVFTGALDWHANADGISWLLDEIWPRVRERRSNARLVVVGRNPPRSFVERGEPLGVTFPGFVDSIHPYVHGAGAYVIPLRVGGGTRIKAYEAMALGPPVVSTALGVEGLDVRPDDHYLRADDAAAFADAVCRVFEDRALREGLSQRAREHVVESCSYRRAARVFEEICESVTG